jgi:hypothetical protein
MILTNSDVQINKKIFFTKKVANHMINDTLNDLKKLFLKRDIEDLAWETGFYKRCSGKIRGFDFLAALLVSTTSALQSSLEGISDILAHIGIKTRVTAQAIMKRINSEKTVEFFKAIYEKVLEKKFSQFSEVPADLLSHFSKVLLQDSTSVTLHQKLQKEFKGSGGRASKASAKLDLIYDYKNKKYETIKLTDQGEADQKLALRIEDAVTEGSLVIRDLGYLRVDSLIKIVSQSAFFLSRLKSNIAVYLNQEDENSIDLGDYIMKHCESGILDRTVYITAKKFPTRLIAFKAPKEVADKRRRTAKASGKKQGRKLREATLKFLGFTVFITNVPLEIWKAQVIGTIYRIRWQIELIFKCWKSKAQINYLEGTDAKRIECLIYAKLIYILLVNQIYVLAELIGMKVLNRMISMTKVYEWMAEKSRIIKIITGSLKVWEKRSFIESISKSMCMQSRNRKTTFESICEGIFYCEKMS